MLIATWIVTGVLAAFNLLSGASKAFTPWPQLQGKMPWTASTGRGLAYLAAWSEIVGAVGAVIALILAHTLAGWEWAAWVSVAAVIGLTLIQVLAVGLHVTRKEFKGLPINLGLIVLGLVSIVLIITTR